MVSGTIVRSGRFKSSWKADYHVFITLKVFGINLFLIWVLIKLFEFIWECCRGRASLPPSGSRTPSHLWPPPSSFRICSNREGKFFIGVMKFSSTPSPKLRWTRSRQARNPPAGFQTFSPSLAPPLSKWLEKAWKHNVWWRISRWSGPLHHEPRQNGRVVELHSVPLVALSSDE